LITPPEMNQAPANPFVDADRRALWEICVARDIAAFLAADWNICADDFLAEGFVGVHGKFATDPDSWQLSFPTLDSYRQAWEEQSRDFAREKFVDDPCAILYSAMRLDPIQLQGDHAFVHKKFAGELRTAGGKIIPLHWQSLFFARRTAGGWKLRGFVGYLPWPWPVGAEGKRA